MCMLDKDRIDNLASRVDDTVSEAAEEVLKFVMNERNSTYGRLHALALEVAGITGDELEYMGEHDDNNPKYTLYYAELTNLMMKTLGRTIDKMSF